MNSMAPQQPSERLLPTEQAGRSSLLFFIPFAFALGALLFVFGQATATLSRARSIGDFRPDLIAFGFTVGAAACFLFIFERSRVVTRIFSAACLLVAFYYAVILLWAIIGSCKLLLA